MRRNEIVASGATEPGFSLVELLVSMLLGVFLSAVMVTAYLGAKRSYFHGEQVARIQENGRYAMRLLTRELGMAGFYGGLFSRDEIAAANPESDCSDRPWALDGTRPLEFVNDFSGQDTPLTVDSTTLTCMDGVDVLAGTDILAVKRTAAEASLRRGVPAAALTRSTVRKWYLFLPEQAHPRWEQLRPIDLFDPSRHDSTQSYWSAVSRIFFIRNYSEAEGDGMPGLCMETLAASAMTARCMVQGVENMQFEFGIDTDTDGVPNQYKAAPQVDDMERAVAAKIHLLLRSLSPVSGHRDNKTYTLGQVTVPATGDAYLRRVFTTTVRLRNRIKPGG